LDKDGRLTIVPKSTFEKLQPDCAYAVALQGRDKKSDAAKKISKILGYKDLDQIIRELPAGDFSISEGAAYKPVSI
jgi:hypothetical protein